MLKKTDELSADIFNVIIVALGAENMSKVTQGCQFRCFTGG